MGKLKFSLTECHHRKVLSRALDQLHVELHIWKTGCVMRPVLHTIYSELLLWIKILVKLNSNHT